MDDLTSSTRKHRGYITKNEFDEMGCPYHSVDDQLRIIDMIIAESGVRRFLQLNSLFLPFCDGSHFQGFILRLADLCVVQLDTYYKKAPNSGNSKRTDEIKKKLVEEDIVPDSVVQNAWDGARLAESVTERMFKRSVGYQMQFQNTQKYNRFIGFIVVCILFL